MRRYLLALSVALSVLLAPSLAFADDGFLGGLQDLSGTRQVDSAFASPESEFLDEYEPVVRELESVEVQADEDVSVIDYIESIWTNLRVETPSGKVKFFNVPVLRIFMTNGLGGVAFVVVAAWLVFFWWGVRNALRMLMGAWRKGHASV